MANRNAKWFFAAQRDAEAHLNRLYPNRETSYQIVDENRVVTGYLCDRGDGSYRKVEVHVVRGVSVSATVYELVPIALVGDERAIAAHLNNHPTEEETEAYYEK